MMSLRPEDSLHRSIMNRLLMEVIDRPVLSHNLAFKGGTCAAMLGFLDRFSVDLDFDVLNDADEAAIRSEFHRVFNDLNLVIGGELDNAVFFQLKYPSSPGKRNTLKVGVSSQIVKSNQYRAAYLPELDRLMTCQTVETMFANKLVAVTDRYRRYRTVAGRDIYDIHYFFVQGYAYHAPIIQERTGMAPREYLKKLSDFIKEHVTQTMVSEDLNPLMPDDRFQRIRKILIPETLAFLAREALDGRGIDL